MSTENTSTTSSTAAAAAAAPAETLLTPAAAATPAASAAATPGAETLLTPSADAAKGTPAPNADPTKNPDGSAKTADQIAADKVAADKAAADAKAKAGAPDKYEDFKAPEGVTLDKDAVTQFTTLAKELNIPQEKAQALVELAAKNQQAAFAQQTAAWNNQRATWRTEIEKDPTVGGAHFKASIEHALYAKTVIGKDIPGLEDVFKTGWGDNPALFKFMVAVGKRLGEDKAHNGGAPAVQEKSAAEIFYGKK